MMRVLHVGRGAELAKPLASSTDNVTPTSFALEQNYPNPFNPSTQITFQLPYSEHVELKVYNSLGREVRRLVSGQYDAGVHSVAWNGTNDYGRKVSSGTYFYTIQAGTFNQTKKMQLLK